jgi:hypothetical protein
MQTGRETYIAVVCIGGADRTRLSVINIINWGVWLGRHICKIITQVFQDKLRKNRNLSSTIKRKACLILIFSTNTNRESVIQRSFKLCKETLTNLYLEVSEKLPKG